MTAAPAAEPAPPGGSAAARLLGPFWGEGAGGVYVTRDLDAAHHPGVPPAVDTFWELDGADAPRCYVRLTPGRFAGLVVRHAEHKAVVAAAEAEAASSSRST